MTTGVPSSAATRRISAELREGEVVKPLELYFDLVFVLGFTQCTALIAANPSWESVAQGLLVLWVLWWAWAGYAWLTSVIDPEEGSVRIAFFAAMAGLLVVALCVPKAFDDRALAFALAYGVVRAGHVALFLLASRDDLLFAARCSASPPAPRSPLACSSEPRPWTASRRRDCGCSQL